MDDETLATYDAQAARIAAGHRAITPARTQALIGSFFQPGGRTADVGCGSGRDTAWMADRGFAVIGYDGSAGMLAEARASHPELQFIQATLPALDGVPDATYANVLCNAVLMHLPRATILSAVAGLARILAPGGRLLVSWRSSTAEGEREPDGRLFTHIPPEVMATLCGLAGLAVIYREAREDDERPGVIWHTVVAEKSRGAV